MGSRRSIIIGNNWGGERLAAGRKRKEWPYRCNLCLELKWPWDYYMVKQKLKADVKSNYWLPTCKICMKRKRCRL